MGGIEGVGTVGFQHIINEVELHFLGGVGGLGGPESASIIMRMLCLFFIVV